MSGTSESAARRLRDRGKAAGTIRPACVRKLVSRTITDWRLYSRLTVAAAFAQTGLFPQRRARPRTMDIAILLTLVLINGLFAMSGDRTGYGAQTTAAKTRGRR